MVTVDARIQKHCALFPWRVYPFPFNVTARGAFETDKADKTNKSMSLLMETVCIFPVDASKSALLSSISELTNTSSASTNNMKDMHKKKNAAAACSTGPGPPDTPPVVTGGLGPDFGQKKV